MIPVVVREYREAGCDPRYQSVSSFDMFPGQVIEGRTEKELFDLLSVEYVWERLQPMMDEVFIRKAKL